MERTVLSDRSVRDYLGGFSEQKWPLVLQLTLRHGIHALRSRFDLSALSVDDLARLVRLDDIQQLESVLARDHPSVLLPSQQQQQQQRPVSAPTSPAPQHRRQQHQPPQQLRDGEDPYGVYPDWWWHPVHVPPVRDERPHQLQRPRHTTAAAAAGLPSSPAAGHSERMAFSPPRRAPQHRRSFSSSESPVRRTTHRQCDACEFRALVGEHAAAVPMATHHHAAPSRKPVRIHNDLPYDVSKVESVLKHDIERLRRERRMRKAAEQQERQHQPLLRRRTRRTAFVPQDEEEEEDEEVPGADQEDEEEEEDEGDDEEQEAEETPDVVRDDEVRGVRWRTTTSTRHEEEGEEDEDDKPSTSAAAAAAASTRPKQQQQQPATPNGSRILFPRFTPSSEAGRGRTAPAPAPAPHAEPAVTWGAAPGAPQSAATQVHHHTHIHYYEPAPRNVPAAAATAASPNVLLPTMTPARAAAVAAEAAAAKAATSYETETAATLASDESTLEQLGQGLRGGLDQLRADAQEVLRRLQQAELERARLQDELVAMS